jgi:hypothetical protein
MNFDFVPAPRARELIGEVLQPLVAEFQHVRGLMWARELNDGIRAVVDVQAIKGAQFDASYGICCEWVPFQRGQGYRWHRTLKQTRLDLWVDHFTLDAEPRQWIATSGGEAMLRRQARRAMQQVAERAPTWWDTVSDPAGVLSEARRQAANTYDIHRPRARFVVAFTLARLGDLAAAREELAADSDPHLGQQASDELHAKLEELAARSRP